MRELPSDEHQFDDDHEPTYGLVMPFVVTSDNGGPYDSIAFVAGARFGQDSTELKTEAPSTPVWERYVFPPMAPQYDLLAMHHGYVMTAEPWDEHPDDWVLVTFRKCIDGGDPSQCDMSSSGGHCDTCGLAQP